jgi:tripartite-type tricarboxylate transporter receptor subunit TctC
MDEAAVSAFEKVLAAMKAAPEFSAALEKGAQVPAVRGPAETAEFLAKELEFVKSLMSGK